MTTNSELKHVEPEVEQEDEWGPTISHIKAPFEIGDVFFYTVLIGTFFGCLNLYGERFWSYILGHYSKPVIILGGTFIVSEVGFWFWVTLLAVLDLYQFPRSFWRYKIQPLKVPTWEWYTRALWVVFQNQFLVGVPTGILMYKLMEWRGNPIGMELPTIWDLAKESIGFFVIEEFGFYYGHRLLHHPMFYKRIHKQHHLYTAPIGIAGQTNAINSHCGFHLPLFPSPLAHDYHHEVFNKNFGPVGFLDWFHDTAGSREMTLEKKRQREAEQQVKKAKLQMEKEE
ncbi:Chromosome 5 4 [Modicella reniformis]|uniref:Chromosome 5 4 n=1 Tax=Modicella reniformis TaxID=1440133 RepID=A0A9P6IM27_9FUNG|nr:Chromosome 5 4 [Modicella reniformis]